MTKKRREFMNWSQYSINMRSIIKQIKESGKEYDKIYTIKRGGLIPATHLAYQLDIMDIYTNTDDFYPDKKTLVVDDISDSGETLYYLRRFDTVCICYKEGTKVIPKFFARKYPKDVWVVFPWDKDLSIMMRDRDRRDKGGKSRV